LIHQGEDSKKEFEFETEEFGSYEICFTSTTKVVQRVDIDVGPDFVYDHDANLLKEESLQPLDILLSRAEDAAQASH
jgi:emp24/gp25L/p24 family/GOLD